MPPNSEPTGTPPVEPTAPPVATPPKSDPVVTPESVVVPEGYVLTKEKDINNLKSQIDKAKNSTDPNTEAVLSALLQKDAVRETMATSEFKEKYPDVTEAELLEANPMDEAEIEKFAAAKQARYEVVKQDALKKVQVATAPTISQADRDTKLQELKTPAKTSRFQQALQVARMQVK